MIFTAFAISIIYSISILLCTCSVGLVSSPFQIPYPFRKSKNRIKYDLSSDKIFAAELIIFGVSLYLNLLLGILTADGDSAFFVTVTKHFAESKSPFAGLYANGDITYPPLFHYIYYILARFIQMLGISFAYISEAFILAVKLPGILCEFLMAWMLYRYTKKNRKPGQTIPVLLLTLLNPAFLFVTAYICQIDALYVCFMLLTMLLIYRNRIKTSYFTFAAAILCKFQAIFITPVMLYAAVNTVFLHGFNRKKLRGHLLASLSAVCCILLSYLPFVWDFSSGTFYPGGIWINFTSSVKSYGWASQNTYNFWNLAGYNFRQDQILFGPLPCIVWGTIFIILLVMVSTFFFWRGRHDSSIYPMTGALLVSGTVCFATRMMPRYLYPAIPLLIWGFLLKPSLKKLLCVICFTVAFFLLNVFDYVVYPAYDYTPELILPKIISVYFLLCFLMLNYTIFTETGQSRHTLTPTASLRSK